MLGVLHHNLAAIALCERAGWTLVSTVDFVFSDGRVTPMHCYSAPG